MTEVERCPVEQWEGFTSWQCSRPVKRDGLCGIHAAAKERRQRNDQDRREARRVSDERYAVAAKYAGEIRELTGLQVVVLSEFRLGIDVEAAETWLDSERHSSSPVPGGQPR